VPEKRAAEYGKTIRLAVMILRQKDTAPRGEPTLLLAGGPGQDAIGLFADLLGYWDHFRSEGYPKAEVEGQLRDWLELRAAMDLYVSDMAEREFVVFDQRGTGYSEPSLKCHGEAYDDCYKRLTQAGVDLSAYNTVENAADVDAVRRALGYPRVNLMGGSYGTRLGYEVLRRYGDSVRAVVFDSALPPEVDWYAETVEHYAGNLDVLFDHCAADAACGKAYANLKNEFYDLVERLDAEPLPVPGGGHFDGADLLELTWDAMYDVGKIRWLPALIHQTYQKDYRILERWGQTVGREDAGEVMAWGMSYSVECAEQWSAETWRATLEAAARLPRAIAADAVEQFAHMEDVCAVWKVPTLPVHESLKSDVPALFLSGEFDPATPPAFAEASAGNFTRAYRYVFPGMGHTDGFFSRCWTSIQFQFLDEPARAPDASCIADMPDGQFIVAR
jgi:pimeloyl-ACP methyl ester carboxylesterase